jgi:hypothetical protein
MFSSKHICFLANRTNKGVFRQENLAIIANIFSFFSAPHAKRREQNIKQINHLFIALFYQKTALRARTKRRVEEKSSNCGAYWKKFGLSIKKIRMLIFSPPPQAAGRNLPKIAAGRAKRKGF